VAVAGLTEVPLVDESFSSSASCSADASGADALGGSDGEEAPRPPLRVAPTPLGRGTLLGAAGARSRSPPCSPAARLADPRPRPGAPSPRARLRLPRRPARRPRACFPRASA
jgi:hypothetical protein